MVPHTQEWERSRQRKRTADEQLRGRADRLKLDAVEQINYEQQRLRRLLRDDCNITLDLAAAFDDPIKYEWTVWALLVTPDGNIITYKGPYHGFPDEEFLSQLVLMFK